jgi:hypothetical protein
MAKREQQQSLLCFVIRTGRIPVREARSVMRREGRTTNTVEKETSRGGVRSKIQEWVCPVAGPLTKRNKEAI